VKRSNTIVTANGKPAVLLNIYRQPTATGGGGGRGASGDREATEDHAARVTLESFYDQSVIVHDSITSVRDAILIGLALASLILVLFLRDWGTSLVAGLVIPATVAVTFIALRVLGESFNLMTLGGLAAAVGLVIDDAIVVVENICGASRRGADAGGSDYQRDPGNPRAAGRIDNYADRGFLPLIAITGVTGVFFRALALTVGVALLTSLGLALTWNTDAEPLLHSRAGRASRGCSSARHAGIRASAARYAGASIVFCIFGVAVMAGSYWCYQALGSDLLPSMDEGGFIVDYLMPAARRWGYESGDIGGRRHLARDAGSGEHVPTDGVATGPGNGDRSQPRGHFRKA